MVLCLEQVRQRREVIERLAAQYGARDVRIFGSVARGQQREASDLDVLVKFDRGRSLFDLIGLKQDLEELLGCPVDVISEGGLHPGGDRRIFEEAVTL
jgi:predicted nucleotidyltransferase